MTSSASRTGIPAFMKTAIWREKCMSSLRGTFSWVISNWRRLFCSLQLDGSEVPVDERTASQVDGESVLDAR